MNLPINHNGETLKNLLKTKRIRQEDFAAMIGISRNHLLTKLREVQFKDDFKQKVITLLGVDTPIFDELPGQKAGNPNQISPIIGSNNNGVPYYDIDFMGGYDLVFNNQDFQPNFYIDFLPFNDCDCWINVSGKSMGPLIAHGDIVALKKVENWKRFLLEGEIYALVTDNGFRTIKMIGAGPDQDHYTLIPYNKGEDYKPQAIPKDVITHVFRVKGNIKKFF